jgi:hypothetical protein
LHIQLFTADRHDITLDAERAHPGEPRERGW